MKLKSLLEGYAWERKPGQSLPTMQDVQREYQEKKSKPAITEGIEIGAQVKVTGEGLSDVNKMGVVTDVAPSGKFYTVKLKSGLAYFHESDLRVIK
jgi:hypothetical protein